MGDTRIIERSDEFRQKKFVKIFRHHDGRLAEEKQTNRKKRQNILGCDNCLVLTGVNCINK